MTRQSAPRAAPRQDARPGGRGRLAGLRRISPFRYALAALLLVSAVLVGSLMLEVRDKLAELQSSPNDNVQWTLAQLDVELVALAVAIAETLPEHPGAPPAYLDEIRLRYDILYSRVDTLSNSKLYQQAFENPRLEADFRFLASELYALADLIDHPNEVLDRNLPLLHQGVMQLRERARQVISEGNLALAYNASASRSGVSDVLFRLALATGFLLIVLSAMIVLFRRLANVADSRLQQNLATSARLEAIFSTSRDAIAVVDPDGRIVNLNRAGENLFGRPGRSMRGERIGRLLHRTGDGAPQPVTGGDLFAMARSGRMTGIRLIGKHPDGTEIPVEISVDISTREAHPICVCVIRDIAHQTAIEQALTDSRDQARAGERAKARFLGVVSHEMRTPLNGILGTIDLIDDERRQGEIDTTAINDTYLPVLRQSSETLLTLVNDVLDITQIENGMRLSARSFDMDRMLTDLVLAETARARAQGNRLSLIPSDPIGRVTGDPDRLRQILSNLVVNAIKFTRNGQISIEATRLPDGLVEVQISDTGYGMSAEDLARVFDDFVRTDRAVELQVQGTGLGLGIAKSLVEAMGGTIGAESEPGAGSLFWFRIPLPEAGPEDAPLTEVPTWQGSPARILLVEDNATNRLIARRILENDGHEVTEAEHGRDAVDIAAKTPFDIILMDISMPVMDGITAATRIRGSAGPNANTHIAALTAYVAEGLDERQTSAAMDAVLHKPLSRDALRREIALALGQGAPDPVPEAGQPRSLVSALDPDMARRLTERFIRDSDPKFQTLEARVTDPDPNFDALACAVHDLAGSAANFGELELHRILASTETALRQADNRRAADLARQAVQLWSECRERLQASLTLNTTEA